MPAAFALVANGDPYTYLARLPLHFAPDARFEDGLELVAPRRVATRAIPRLTFAGVLGRKARGVIYRYDLDRIEVRSSVPLPLQVDGEDLGDVEQAVRATLANVRGAPAVFEGERGDDAPVDRSLVAPGRRSRGRSSPTGFRVARVSPLPWRKSCPTSVSFAA